MPVSLLSLLRRGVEGRKGSAPDRLVYDRDPSIANAKVPHDDPVHVWLREALERCRLFPHDLEVFRRVEPETRFLPYVTDTNKTAVDVGANVGFFSALLAPLSRDVFAFEANPDLHPYLTVNLRRYANVRLLPFAAGRDAGEIAFHSPDVAGAYSVSVLGMAGVRSDEFIAKMGLRTKTVRAPMLPVDALRLQNVSFLKVDVEGHELDVLEGAAQTIAGNRPAVMVENEWRHNPSCQNVFDFLLARGYRGYFMDRATSTLQPFERFDLDRHQRNLLDAEGNVTDMSRYVLNFIFVPRENDRLADHSPPIVGD